MKMKSLAFIVLAFLSIMSCKEKMHTTNVERAFYYWKNTEYALTENELHYLKKDSINVLYVKFFEVENDINFGIIPSVKTALELNYWNYPNGDSLYKVQFENLHIVPTVYIRNTVFATISKGALDTLADNIVFLTTKYFNRNFQITGVYSEIQIDCDWTPSTRENYFYFLRKIKSISKKMVSATLRLYPYKYPDKMGVLPVDKAMLMCYNLNSPLSKENENSILDNTILKSYLKNATKYPTHVDIALPVFNWVLWYRNNIFAGIINPSQNQLFNTSLKKINEHWYVVEKDILLVESNTLLKAGDKVKLEAVDEETLHESIAMIQQYVVFDDSTTVSLFHLDNKQLTKYSNETIHSFYTDFTK